MDLTTNNGKSNKGPALWDMQTLLLVACKLKNRATASRKIFEGANKTVCAWIECDSVAVIQATDSAWAVMDRANYYQFNPKHYPAWLNDHSEESDDKEIGIIVIDSGTIIEANELTTEDIKIEKVFKC